MPRQGSCKDCKSEELVGPRGLCNACYSYHHNHHTLNQFPRSTWKREELLTEWDFFKRSGLSVREAAERIGVSLSALRQAIYRGKRHTRQVPTLWDQDLQSRKIN